jgi:hypothetical protein
LQRLLRSIAENLRVRRVEGPQKATSRPTDARNPQRKTETIDAD